MKKRFSKKVVGAIALLLVVAVAAVFGLSGCRDLTADDVVNGIYSNLDESTSYLATGLMQVESEGQTHRYNVQVGFQRTDSGENFRVTMRNESTGNEQIILKNCEGVFVLTPALNKQFKFQSDWPMTSSQVYLYQSLLNDILNATEPTFEACDDSYTFIIETDFHADGRLVEQFMQFDRKYLTPTLVEVRDAEGVARLSMTFESFEWNNDVCEDFFVVDAIMELAQDVMGDYSFPVTNIYDLALVPTYLPVGSELIDRTPIPTLQGERVILTFGGEHEFTLIQESARMRHGVELVRGEPVMINGTVGAISENSLSWQRNGVEFFLVSNTLDRDQLITVAASVDGYNEK